MIVVDVAPLIVMSGVDVVNTLLASIRMSSIVRDPSDAQMSDASSDVPDVVSRVKAMDLNVTVAPSIVKTFLLSFTFFTVFETDPDDG